MDKFLERTAKMTAEEMENLKNSMSAREIEFIYNLRPCHKTSGAGGVHQ